MSLVARGHHERIGNSHRSPSDPPRPRAPLRSGTPRAVWRPKPGSSRERRARREAHPELRPAHAQRWSCHSSWSRPPRCARADAFGRSWMREEDRGHLDEREPNARHREERQHHAQDHRRAPFAALPKRAHAGRRQPATGEAARMGPVVDRRHHEAHHEHDQRPLPDLRGERRMADPAPIDDQGGQEAEDRARGADGGMPGDRIGDQESDHPRDVEDHERTRRPPVLHHGGAEISDPEHVEEDVEQRAMQVDRGQQRPPPVLRPGQSTRHPELIERARAGRQDVEKAARMENRVGLERQRGDVEHDACADDDAHQIEPPPDETLQPGTVAIEAGIPGAAERALLLADRDELAAARADHRALSLAHGSEVYARRPDRREGARIARTFPTLGSRHRLEEILMFLIRRLVFAAALCLCASAAMAAVKTRVVNYEQGGTPLQGYLAWNDSYPGKRPGVVVVHEWWGHNEHARRQARRLAEAGYTAFALDMYGKGKVTTHPAEAQAFMAEASKDPATMMARFDTARELLARDPHRDPRKMAAIGYCFGGGAVLNAANAGEDLKAVVSFHGAI